jgi:hypothetical protein
LGLRGFTGSEVADTEVEAEADEVDSLQAEAEGHLLHAPEFAGVVVVGDSDCADFL